MSLEMLQNVWIGLIAVLWIGYFVLEGFDFGVGILLPVVAKNEAERRTVLTALGPVWDGNEVWLLVAGGATFAAFPEWYATLFSGFYLALLLILVALIVRGVAFEYRSKRGNVAWRKRWDIAITVASFLPALLWGVAFANDGGTIVTGSDDGTAGSASSAGGKPGGAAPRPGGLAAAPATPSGPAPTPGAAPGGAAAGDQLYDEAFKKLQEGDYAAAERGFSDSQFNLAILYERGLGTVASLADAYVWYSLSAKQGDHLALCCGKIDVKQNL